MNVIPIHALSTAQVRDIASHAAERGERIEDANPYTTGTTQHAIFVSAFNVRAADLRRVDA